MENIAELKLKIKSNPVKSSYDYLRELTNFKPDFTAWSGSIDPMTNRVKYICSVLNVLNLDYELDIFPNYTNEDNTVNFVNIVVPFHAFDDTKDTIIYLAHHDVVNLESENCNDNTASIANLLELCDRLQNIEHKTNIYVIFTDGEEIGGKGAKRLAEVIKSGLYGNVLITYNSELSSTGKYIFGDSKDMLDHELLKNKNILHFRTPFNDSVILRSYGINSICFGCITKWDVNKLNNGIMCKTWKLCHRLDDTFNKAKKNNMKKYVKFLLSLIK